MSLEKIVIIAGLPGVGVGRLLDYIKTEFLPNAQLEGIASSDVAVANFEHHLRRVYGMASIEKIALLLLSSSREMVLNKFRQALAEVEGEAGDKRILIMGMHLSYFTRGVIAPNPILPEILRMAPRVYILYLIEDYYDALRRIAEKMMTRVLGHEGLYVEKYTLDPLTYLIWRGAEFNILNMMLTGTGGKVKAFIFGVKHRIETLLRMLRYLVAGERFLHIYLSHPISIYRELRRLGGPSLSFDEIPGVDAIEALKDLLISAMKDVIFYEPTTIDELILTTKADACTKMGGPPARDESISSGFAPDPVIGPHNRWPVVQSTLMNDYPYTRGENRDLARDSLLRELFGPLLRELRVEFCSQDLSYLGDMLSQLIISQIEIRDYAYVEQSDATLVVIPLFYYLEKNGEESADAVIYAHIAGGVDAEIRRAHALAKRVAILFIPVSIKRLTDVLCSNNDDCAKQVIDVIASQSLPPFKRRISLKASCFEEVAKSDAMHESLSIECREDYESLKSVFDEFALSLTRGMGAKRPLGPLSAADGSLIIYNAKESSVALSHLLRGFEEQRE